MAYFRCCMKKKPSESNRFVVIMAGGRGERFWPVSREKRPKQLLSLLGKRSFLQQAVDLVKPLVPLTNVFVITNKVQLPEVIRQLPGVPRPNLIAEPMGRDTCAAVALGGALVASRNLQGVLAVLPADHVIPEGDKFRRVLEDSFSFAQRDEVIITIGIKPTEPSTGYGYIRVGAPLSPADGQSKTRFFKAEQFTEKPPADKALEYLQSGHYRWNAGMFVWSVPTLLGALAQFQPHLHQTASRWRTVRPSALARALACDYPALPKVSVDYALMEKVTNVVVADGDFLWDDVGSWTALARHLKPDPEGNCVVGEVICIHSGENIVFDARRKKTPVALLGLKDMILVLTDDSTLAAHKSQAQQIKQIVARLAQITRHQKLL